MKRAEQAADTRTALLDAARQLFVSRGYLNTKITDITAAAGRSAGSFYNHFAGKEELLEALLDEVASAGDDAAMVEGHSADFTDPAAIRFHLVAYWSFHRHHAATMQALNQAALVNQDFARRLQQFGRTQLDDLGTHLATVGSLPAAPDTTLLLLASLMEGMTRIWPAPPDEAAIEAMTRFAYRAINGKDY